MKQRGGIFILLALAVFALFIKERHGGAGGEPMAANERSLRCYYRAVAATAHAPYEVHEAIELTIDGETVAGVKSGTQAGPDMTNGYEGTLAGTKKGSELSLLFSYTIEGSQQSEQEVYALAPDALIKHRYPLIEHGGILVPDTREAFVEQRYTERDCKEE